MPCWAFLPAVLLFVWGLKTILVGLSGPDLALMQRPLLCNAVLAAVSRPTKAADKPGWVWHCMWLTASASVSVLLFDVSLYTLLTRQDAEHTVMERECDIQCC